MANNEKKSIIDKVIANFKTIRKTITGTDNDDLQLKISRLSRNVSKFSNLNTRNIFQDLVKQLYTKNIGDNQQEDISKILEDFEIKGNIEQDRQARYSDYSDIVEKISYAKRALQVIKDSILSPDDYSTTSLKYKIKGSVSTNTELKTIERTFKQIVEDTELHDHLDEIIEMALYLGDYFVEIVNVNNELKKSGLLKENKKLESFTESVKYYKKVKNEEEYIPEDRIEEIENLNITIELVESNKFRNLSETKGNGNKKKNKEVTFDDLFLEYYDPSTVIRLGDKICFGYLVFPSSISKTQAFTSMDLSNDSVSKVLDKLFKKLDLKNNQDKLKNDPDLRKMIAKLLLYKKDKVGNSTIDEPIRFVPESNMQHFKIESIKNAPYGKSIFFGQEFLAKILILIQTTIAIHRISNSGDRGVVNVEIGLPRDARSIVDQMKKKFRKKRYSVDDIGTIKEIPSQLSSFENIYLPMKDGKRFVEFDSMNESRNISERVDDLREIRDNFIAGLPVPPAYLSVEENVESRSLLAHENVIFARSIVNYQKMFSRQLTQLVRKIYEAIYGLDKNIFNVEIVFSPPKALKLEMDIEYYRNLTDMINTFKELGYSGEYIKNKYLLDDLNSEELENMQIKNKIEDKLIKTDDEEGGVGGF